jgi:hypothetical protein
MDEEKQMSKQLTRIAACLAIGLLAGTVSAARADTMVTVDPGQAWLGYMNVYDLGGVYQWGSPWGTADLIAVFNGPVLTLQPNSINDPSDYWYIGGGGPGAQGNKIMEANMYVEDGTLVGQTVTFSGVVQDNSLTAAHVAYAFIKDFAPDYSSFTEVRIPLAPGAFSFSLPTDPTPGRHVQYGFQTIGPCVWITDLPLYGQVDVTAIPEPATLVSLALAGLLAGARRR